VWRIACWFNSVEVASNRTTRAGLVPVSPAITMFGCEGVVAKSGAVLIRSSMLPIAFSSNAPVCRSTLPMPAGVLSQPHETHSCPAAKATSRGHDIVPSVFPANCPLSAKVSVSTILSQSWSLAAM
jgi:hypothetical protein